MRLAVRHLTAFRYARAVRDSFNEARLKPVSNEHQRVISFDLAVRPTALVREYEDFFANAVHYFEVAAPHTDLAVESRCLVETNRSNWLDETTAPAPLERLAECSRMERCFDYLLPTAYVSMTPEIWRSAVDATFGQTDIWQAAQTLCRWVRGRLEYLPASTTVRTTAAEAFGQRQGVCQDFAHVLIALCRSIRIPALYVSGYLATPGAQASHAWSEVFLPGVGWRALDPTHACQPDERYIKVAVGRDYADVPPVSGHFKGPTVRDLFIDVEVQPVLESQ